MPFQETGVSHFPFSAISIDFVGKYLQAFTEQLQKDIVRVSHNRNIFWFAQSIIYRFQSQGICKEFSGTNNKVCRFCTPKQKEIKESTLSCLADYAARKILLLSNDDI